MAAKNRGCEEDVIEDEVIEIFACLEEGCELEDIEPLRERTEAEKIESPNGEEWRSGARRPLEEHQAQNPIRSAHMTLSDELQPPSTRREESTRDRPDGILLLGRVEDLAELGRVEDAAVNRDGLDAEVEAGLHAKSDEQADIPERWTIELMACAEKPLGCELSKRGLSEQELEDLEKKVGKARRVWTPRPGRGRSGIGLKTCKEQGEWAELVFMARLRQLGLVVLHPYGDSLPYDVGVEEKGRLLRVQVKSTTFQRGRTYELNLVGPGRRRYRRGDLDFFAVYVAPLDCGTSCRLR
jgi:PD-(D/E)XK endonuclease